jgi:hypothetical protein
MKKEDDLKGSVSDYSKEDLFIVNGGYGWFHEQSLAPKETEEQRQRVQRLFEELEF